MLDDDRYEDVRTLELDSLHAEPRPLRDHALELGDLLGDEFVDVLGMHRI